MWPVEPDINSRIYLWRGDLRNLEVDAVVNSTNELLDEAHSSPGLYEAVGSGLAEECITLVPDGDGEDDQCVWARFCLWVKVVSTIQREFKEHIENMLINWKDTLKYSLPNRFSEVEALNEIENACLKIKQSFSVFPLASDFLVQQILAVECIFCSACIRFAECCPHEGITEKLWSGLENFVFDWLINADKSVTSDDYSVILPLLLKSVPFP